MFRKLKFITSGEMLEFSRTQTSLCSFVCTKMRVADYQRGEYWDMVKHTAKKMIEQQRTNATLAIKKGFRGKSKNGGKRSPKLINSPMLYFANIRDAGGDRERRRGENAGDTGYVGRSLHRIPYLQGLSFYFC